MRGAIWPSLVLLLAAASSCHAHLLRQGTLLRYSGVRAQRYNPLRPPPRFSLTPSHPCSSPASCIYSQATAERRRGSAAASRTTPTRRKLRSATTSSPYSCIRYACRHVTCFHTRDVVQMATAAILRVSSDHGFYDATQDKNPSPEAKQQFQRVAQAYEVSCSLVRLCSYPSGRPVTCCRPACHHLSTMD